MLIEVLISVLIFSVGVVALVALQAAMTKAQTEAKARADATNLAAELVGLMWSDIPNLGRYDSTNCANYNACNMWLSKVNETLPSAVANPPQVSVVTTAGLTQGNVVIIIQWEFPNGDVRNYTMTTTVTI